jgi:hypothetical protein
MLKGSEKLFCHSAQTLKQLIKKNWQTNYSYSKIKQWHFLNQNAFDSQNIYIRQLVITIACILNRKSFWRWWTMGVFTLITRCKRLYYMFCNIKAKNVNKHVSLSIMSTQLKEISQPYDTSYHSARYVKWF